MKRSIIAFIIAFSGFYSIHAQAAETVNMVNFVHAETVKYFTTQQSEAKVNTFKHERVAINKDNQTIIRSNTDLLYSTAVVDVSKGATFSLPAGKAYDTKSLDAVRSSFEADVNSVKTELGFSKTVLDEYQYRLGAALAWGALPVEHAAYTGRAGTGSLKCATINFDVPPLRYEEGGYWSITTYGPTGWVEVAAPAIDSTSVQLDKDGTVTIGFNCTGMANNIEVVDGWNIAVRLYRPLNTGQINKYTAAFPAPKTM